MGCGSSTEQPKEIQPAVAPGTTKSKSNGPTQNKAAERTNHHSPNGTGSIKSEAANTQGAANGASSTSAGVANAAAAESPARAPSPPPVEKKKFVSRHSGGELPQATAAAAVASDIRVVCDFDHSHQSAAVYCGSCETHLCDPCDQRIHGPGTSHESHHRTVLATGSKRKRKSKRHSKESDQPSKFVVHQSTAPQTTDEHHHHQPHGENADSTSTAAAISPRSSKFVVGKFERAQTERNPQMESGGDGESQQPSRLTDSIRHSKGNVMNIMSITQLSSLNVSELDALWHRYDRDHNNVLDRHELKTLSDDIIVRLIELVKEDLRKTNGTLSASEIDQKAEEEKWFVLPGKNMKETEVEMKRMLYSTLDLNNDGKITKQEYLMGWNAFAKQMFTLKEENAIACTIM